MVVTLVVCEASLSEAVVVEVCEVDNVLEDEAEVREDVIEVADVVFTGVLEER
jgi:hypothetical protein